MPQCIYCQQERSADCFTKSEHVLPQSFGKFRQNMTLNNIVCDQCNQYFGNNLEIFLARDTFEGQQRFKYGIKSPEEFKSVGRDSRIIVKSAEGDFAGCYMQRYYCAEKGELVVKPLPQVGFMMARQNKYHYFLLDEIPTMAELHDDGYQETHPRPIVGLEVDSDELSSRLADKGIPFRYRGHYVPESRLDSIGCELEGVIDHAIFRSVAKIAFNYLAHGEGADFVQHQAFDKARRYIRWQHAPGYQLIRLDQTAVLEDEPIEGERRLGHLITMNWASDGISVLGQVSLFNWVTYSVCLARDFSGPPPSLTRGHFFNVSNQEILELGSRPLG
jgi:hypothetical protein